MVSGLLPAGGEGGLHDYSPLGERVGFLVTSHWGSWFNGYFPLGKLVSGLLPTRGEGRVLGSLLTGDVGFHGYFLKKRDKRKYIKKKKRAKEGKNKFIQLRFVYPFQG